MIDTSCALKCTNPNKGQVLDVTASSTPSDHNMEAKQMHWLVNRSLTCHACEAWMQA